MAQAFRIGAVSQTVGIHAKMGPRAAVAQSRMQCAGGEQGTEFGLERDAQPFAAAADGGAVDMPRLLGMIRGELRKLGKAVNEGEFR